MRIEPLSEHHVRTAFASGVEPLDRYLRTQAGQDARRRVAACFVLVEDRGVEPVGFYTLAATSLALAELPETVTKRLPRYPTVPATLMGRLAVDERHRGKGLGEMLLMDALARALRSEIATFAVVVDAKDERAAEFYGKYGFRALTADGRRLFLPMTEAAQSFA